VTYTIKFNVTESPFRLDALDAASRIKFRSLERAQKTASTCCKAGETSATISDDRGWVVLRVDSKGDWRAP